MMIFLNPRTNFGSVGAYARTWAVDVSASSLSVRVGMRTRRVDFRRLLRLALVPPAVVLGLWLLAVALMSLGD